MFCLSSFYKTKKLIFDLGLNKEMATDSKQVSVVKEQYVREYMLPNLEYINRVSITTRHMMKESDNSDLIGKRESLDDFCLLVGFRQEPPKELNLPSKYYKGVRVIYDKLIGEIEFADH